MKYILYFKFYIKKVEFYSDFFKNRIFIWTEQNFYMYLFRIELLSEFFLNSYFYPIFRISNMTKFSRKREFHLKFVNDTEPGWIFFSKSKFSALFSGSNPIEHRVSNFLNVSGEDRADTTHTMNKEERHK